MSLSLFLFLYFHLYLSLSISIYLSTSASIGARVHPLELLTNRGPLRFQIRDTLGQEAAGPVKDSFICNAQCAIIFFDVTSEASYAKVSDWYKLITRVCGSIPIVVCGNKVDFAAGRKVPLDTISFPRSKGLAYFEVSVLQKVNIYEPILQLARELTRQEDLYILDRPEVVLASRSKLVESRSSSRNSRNRRESDDNNNNNNNNNNDSNENLDEQD